MKLFNYSFFEKNNRIEKKEIDNTNFDQYSEIAKLVKEARIKNNFSVEKLSAISKIPESSLNAIENNIKDLRPKYPFIRSILLKLEKCLFLERNILAGLINKETNTFKKVKNNYIVRKFDSLNSWQGGVLYFLFLILMLFLINRYFISNISIIELQIIEEKVDEKSI